jgi:nucleoside-diphosphate-sugar epimerase
MSSNEQQLESVPLSASPLRAVIGREDRVLLTGAAGFIGSYVVRRLLERGYRNLRCLVRPSSKLNRLEQVLAECGVPKEKVLYAGNLLSRDDCGRCVRDSAVVLHMAAGRGQKSYADAFLNSVLTTRNLLDAVVQAGTVKRFVNVSSFSVYSNSERSSRKPLNEESEIENAAHLRGDAYTFAKVEQDKLVMEYGAQYKMPYVLVRPGVVYGSGNEAIPGRVGIATFGVFLHLGGSNLIPLTYVENCAEAIVLAGLQQGVDFEIFNVVDDDPPRSKDFLRSYKQQVKPFRSIYLPHCISYSLCGIWEWYSRYSERQLPPVFNRRMWRAYWKPRRYSNRKLKKRLGWMQVVSTPDALKSHFDSCRNQASHA